MNTGHLGEVIFEFARIGAITRVTAVHVQTGIEAVIQGPSNYTPSILKKNALRKLDYVLKKQSKK